jgi:hypothetical protein
MNALLVDNNEKERERRGNRSDAKLLVSDLIWYIGPYDQVHALSNDRATPPDNEISQPHLLKQF